MITLFKKKKILKEIIFYINTIIKSIFLFLIIFITIIVIYNLKKNKPRHTKDIFSYHKIFIESHRGVNTEVFQNTMEAFKKAIKYGADSIETDVWLTKDNVLVLLHANSREGSLTNYYDHPGKVINLTWDELSTYRTIKDNLTMPRLNDLIKLAKEKNIYIDVEIKDNRINKVFPHLVKLIEKFDFFDQISLISPFFDYYNKILKYNRYHRKKLVFGFVYDRNTTNFDFTKKGNILSIHWEDATKEVCKRAHKNGMAIIAWIDISEKENFRMYKQLIENGVDVICCNAPNMARDYLNYYYKYK